MSPPQPFSLRIALGDIIDASSSMVVVGHVNDVLPSGAEAAIDNLLGGAIVRHLGARRSRFGTTHLIPTLTTPLPSPCLTVVSMGDGEDLEPERLPELGAALVEAAAVVGVRDAATVLLGAGSLDLRVGDVTVALVSGVLGAVARQPPSERLRELTVVERDAGRCQAIRAAVAAIRSELDVHVYVEDLEVRRTTADVTPAESSLVDHLRLGITRSGEELKVTSIGDGAFDVAEFYPFPAIVAQRIAGSLRTEVLAERDTGRRVAALDGLGAQLFHAFLGDSVRIQERLRDSPNRYVVLRLDESTVDLPWELLTFGAERLALDMRLARQVEVRTPARQAAFVPRPERPAVLVVGDPTGDLPAARQEAEAVVLALQQTNADVTLLHGNVTYKELSMKLDERCWDILHYAGHAHFDALREDAGGLSLVDGQTFTAQDLSSRRYLPRLVVANACYSGATGDPRLPDIGARATRNLVTGVLAAGARGFVGAAWEVDDRAAATFAAALYDELLRGGPGPRGTLGEAVRLGRNAIVDAHGLHQAAWAAYVLYGSPWKRAW